jgi:hypothetical protein
MDDSRIRELTEDVLSQLREAGGAPATDLESRVAALEVTVARLQVGGAGRPSATAPAIHVHTHPSLRLLNVPAGSERCIMEPDKPCIHSGGCRVLGH